MKTPRTLDELLATAVERSGETGLEPDRLRRVVREAAIALGFDFAPGGELADLRDALPPAPVPRYESQNYSRARGFMRSGRR